LRQAVRRSDAITPAKWPHRLSRPGAGPG